MHFTPCMMKGDLGLSIDPKREVCWGDPGLGSGRGPLTEPIPAKPTRAFGTPRDPASRGVSAQGPMQKPNPRAKPANDSKRTAHSVATSAEVVHPFSVQARRVHQKVWLGCWVFLGFGCLVRSELGFLMGNPVEHVQTSVQPEELKFVHPRGRQNTT